MKKKNILFLCTGNSCRSQMAEGWCRELYRDKFNVYSAGTRVHGLNQRAVEVMTESGVDISSHRSKTLDEISNIDFQFIYTVCGDAQEVCPIFKGGEVRHKGFDDPPRLARDLENEQEILNIYRRVRDEIRQFISEITF